MTRELIHQLERLGQERQRLEILLSRQPVWLAWKQLAELAEPADDFGRYMLARRTAELEDELLRDPLFCAHRSVMAAIQVFEGLSAPGPASKPVGERAENDCSFPTTDGEANPDAAAAAAAGADADGHSRSDTIPLPDGPLPDGVFPDDVLAGSSSRNDACSRTMELKALADLRGSPVIAQSVTIHEIPLRKHGEMATLTDGDAPPDRLTRIRRIDKDLAAALVARGVRHFSQIAAFGPADVRALSAALGLGRRISQENWIEQAALLAMKAGAGPAVGLPASSPKLPLPPADAQANADAGSGDGNAGSAGRNGPSAAGIAEVSSNAMSPQRAVATAAKAIAKGISQRRVIPAIIGRDTAVAALADRGEANVEIEADQAEGAGEGSALAAPQPGAQHPGASCLPDMVRNAARRIAAASRVRQASEIERSADPMPVAGHASFAPHECHTAREHEDARQRQVKPAVPDDLEFLEGVDGRIATRLRAEGVTRFDDVANWSAAAVAHVQALLGAAVPISRLGWIEQAALLARGGMTAYAARKARGELAALVAMPIESCVRDEAFAALLCAHALSHAPPEVVVAGLLPPDAEDRLPIAHGDEHADADGVVDVDGRLAVQPIDAEFDEVEEGEGARGSEVVEINAHRPSLVIVREPGVRREHAGAEIIQLRPIIEISADEADEQTDPEHAISASLDLVGGWDAFERHHDKPADDEPFDRIHDSRNQQRDPDPCHEHVLHGEPFDTSAEQALDEDGSKVGDGHAAIGASWLNRPDGRTTADEPGADEPGTNELGDGARVDIAAFEPGPAFVPAFETVHQPAAVPPARPPNIADRITAIERDAAELTGTSRLVLDRFKQGWHNVTGETAFATGDALAPDRPTLTPASTPQAGLGQERGFVDDLAEADVRIVMRQTHAAGLEPISRPHDPDSRLHADDAFDGKGYAAYRQSIEEASVEIVRIDEAAAETTALPSAPELTTPEGTTASQLSARAEPDEVGKVRRFLKALRGE